MIGSSSPLRLAAILAGTSLIIGCVAPALAQTPGAPDRQTTQLDLTMDNSAGNSFSLSDLLPGGDVFSPDSDGISRSEALDNAQVDPGILMYADPSEATEMPVFEPPEDIDPGILWQPESPSEEGYPEDP